MRVDDLREVVLKPNDDTIAMRRALAHQLAGHARPGLRGRQSRQERSGSPSWATRSAPAGESTSRSGSSRSSKKPGTRVPAQPSGLAVEIINCAVPGHSPGQRWYHFSQVGWPMKPDLVIYESTAADVGWDERRLRFLLARGLGWDSPDLPRRARTSAASSRSAAPTSTSGPCGPGTGRSSRASTRRWPPTAGARRADRLGAGSPRRAAERRADQRALIETARAAGFSRIVDVTDAYRRPRSGSPGRRRRRLPSQRLGS